MRLSQSIPFTPVPPRGKTGTQQLVQRSHIRQFENEEVKADKSLLFLHGLSPPTPAAVTVPSRRTEVVV